MIPLPVRPKIVKSEKNKAIFEIEALYPGYGATIGNSMRRILLSSLEGAAITQVKIKNVSHEFSTIPGVMEDVVTIILNLKQLRFKVFGEGSQRATLKVKGEKTVKGSDFDLPTQLELANPDCEIATLTSKSAELEMEILVEKGIGYLSRDTRKKGEELGVGVIPVDAIFTPIKRVGFRMENMRVGERTDFDRLFLEIETDGIVTPEEAFFRAAEILVQHFSLLKETFEKKEAEEKPVQKEKIKTVKKDEKRKTRKKTK
ncbi:MAG: DNA-directed RNA polymerase subunit alpha [bacterium]|nr:DNA-directed RNA polymerase subunit alpha [bacterium]